MKDEFKIIIGLIGIDLILALYFGVTQGELKEFYLAFFILLIPTLVPTIISFKFNLLFKKILFYIIIGLTFLDPIILFVLDERKRYMFLTLDIELFLLVIFLLPAIVSFFYSFKTKNELFYSIMIGINSLTLFILTIILILPAT